MENRILEYKNISKQYPGVLALDDVSLSLARGEVHALAGENGAGKSTLIKTSSGAITPTSGSIIIEGREYKSLTPSTSRENGIGVIYQEFNLVNQLTVYENIFLGEFIKKGCILDKKAMIQKSERLFESLNIKIDPTASIKDLTVGYQQMVEIAKAVSKDIKILIMDEPSAPLTNQEVQAMFDMIKVLKNRGITILYISHRMDEIFQLCDRVSVLRDGKMIKTLKIEDTNREELVNLMVGRPLKETFPKRDINQESKVVLETKNLTGNGVENISIKVKSGQVLGLGGLVGAGRTELAELLFGIASIESGEIYLNEEKIVPKSPRHANSIGIALVPEDRKRQGVLLHMTIRENITFAIIDKITKFGYVNKKKEREIVERMEKDLRIKTPSTEQTVGNLSGGNQQKVVLAKWLARNPDLIIFDEPTRGIDVGAKQEIYNLMNNLTSQGKAIIMISSEMEELLGMSDEIVVLNEGHVAGYLNKNEFSQERVLTYAAENVCEVK